MLDRMAKTCGDCLGMRTTPCYDCDGDGCPRCQDGEMPCETCLGTGFVGKTDEEIIEEIHHRRGRFDD